MNLLFPGSSPTKIKILSSNYHMFIICEYEQPEKKLPHSVEQIVLPTVAIKGHGVRGSVERGQISERRHCICLKNNTLCNCHFPPYSSYSNDF